VRGTMQEVHDRAGSLEGGDGDLDAALTATKKVQTLRPSIMKEVTHQNESSLPMLLWENVKNCVPTWVQGRELGQVPFLSGPNKRN
jgi:hypothetical protein